MKKILLGIVIPVFALALSMGVVGVAHADDDTDIALTSSVIETLIQMIETLQLKIDTADLTDQLMRHEVRTDAREIKEFALDMYEGLTSEDISDLQELLSGYSDIYPEGIVSGYFGPLTRQAVQRFQRKLGIEETGYVGPLTRRALNDLIDDGEITEDEIAMLPAGIANGRGLDKALPQGIWKNLKARRGFAKGNNFGWDDDDSDDDNDDSDDDSNDDSDSTSEEGADEAIKDAQDTIDEAQSEIDESSDDDLIAEAEELLDDAQDKLDSAEEAFDDEDWEEAETLAEDAEELADQADDLFDDSSDDDSDDDDSDDDE